MDKKNLVPQAAQPVNKLSIQDLPIELAELSEEVLSQVSGGAVGYDYFEPLLFDPCCTCVWNPPGGPLDPLDPYGDVFILPLP
ncbi:MAG TPA: DUF5837 family cyanobactin class RiPP [Leptolyngbyaceae cyanobacterium]